MYDALQGNDVRLAYTVNQSTGRVTAVYVMDNEWHNSLAVRLDTDTMSYDYWDIDVSKVNDFTTGDNDLTITLTPDTDPARTDTVYFTWTIEAEGKADVTGSAFVAPVDGIYTINVEDIDIGWDQDATLTLNAYLTNSVNLQMAELDSGYWNITTPVSTDMPVDVVDGRELDIMLTRYNALDGFSGECTITLTNVDNSKDVLTATANYDTAAHTLTFSVTPATSGTYSIAVTQP